MPFSEHNYLHWKKPYSIRITKKATPNMLIYPFVVYVASSSIQFMNQFDSSFICSISNSYRLKLYIRLNTNGSAKSNKDMEFSNRIINFDCRDFVNIIDTHRTKFGL